MGVLGRKKWEDGGASYASRGGDTQGEATAVGISAERLKASIDALGAIEPAFARTVERIGLPEPRISQRGYVTLLRAIVGQQVSIKAAEAIWNRVDAAAGGAADPANLVRTGEEKLRAAGLSRMKALYALSLAEEIMSGRLDLDALPADDEEAIAAMTRVKGIGVWTAEIYLLFAEGRGDIWPAGDLAVRQEIGKILALDHVPIEKEVRALAEAWRPYRGAAAILAWHHRRVKPL
jgi:DNA-3-methyladenine glycosylase II